MSSIQKHVTHDLVGLDATTPCREAARAMAERQIGSVAVRSGGKVVGLVTERDLVERILARGDGDLGSCPIGEAMRTDVPAVPPDASETEVSDLMRDHYTRHLLVRDGSEVVGIISMRDVIRLMLDDKQFLIEQLHTYINGR
jgi:CBS domain-containing protein